MHNPHKRYNPHNLPNHPNHQNLLRGGCVLLWAAALALGACAGAHGHGPGKPGGHGKAGGHGDHHHGHQSPEAFARYAGSMDRPARDAWQQPAALVTALGVKAGDVVADIGAGTGYFLPHFARAVGAAGKVLALDVDERFLELLRKRLQKEPFPNVTPQKIPTDDPALPTGGVDVAFLCNTYHHLGARVEWLRKLARGLRPGGRFVNVDFKDGTLPVGPPAAHKVPQALVVREAEQAGLRLRETLTLLPYQYVQIFERAP